MFIREQLWYAQIGNQVYAFQCRHQRDICGGEPCEKPVIGYHDNIPILIKFNHFAAWHQSMQDKMTKEK